MATQQLNTTNITPPRVPLIDNRTGLISREWYRFFLNLFNLTGSGTNYTSLTDLQVGPPSPTIEQIQSIIPNDPTLSAFDQATINQVFEVQKQIEALSQAPESNSLVEQIAEVWKQIDALSTTSLSEHAINQLAEMQKQIDALSATPLQTALTAADIPPLPYQSNVAPVTYTGDFSVGVTDLWIINNKSGSTCIVTLPSASDNRGRVLSFSNYQAQQLVSASSNVVQVSGGSAGTSILLASSGDSATLVSDGTNWITTQYIPNNVLLLN